MCIQSDLFDRHYPIPETEGIKYAGSKLKILPYIIKILEQLPDVKSVLDGFSGTTRVSQAFAQLKYNTTANDISVWSEVFGKCYLIAERKYGWIQSMIDHLNGLEGYDGWFTEHYGGTESDKKKPFQIKNTRKLDAIRDEIDKITSDSCDKSVLLTSLILALDKCDSTIGHYASYLSDWSARSFDSIQLKMPKLFDIQSVNTVVRGNIFDIIENRSFDLAYLDPPYGSNNEKMPPSRIRYNAYYHIWKTVILNDRPKVFGKANRREDTRDNIDPSIFESFKINDNGKYIAMEAIDKLISKINAHYIILSYSSGGRATKTELMDIISNNGKLKQMFEIDYKKNVMAKMSWTNEWLAKDNTNQEYLFLIEK